MPIIDLHCDTIMALMMASRKGVCKNLYSNDLMLSIEKMNTSNYMAQCLAMFVPFTVNNPYELCKDMLKRAKEEVEEYSEYVKIAYNKNDIINTYNDKKIALVLTFACIFFCSCKDYSVKYNGPDIINMVLREELYIDATSDDQITYASDNMLIADINQDGKIIGRNVGKTNITLSTSEDELRLPVIVNLFEEPSTNFGASTNEIKSLYGEPRHSFGDSVYIYGGGGDVKDWYSPSVWQMNFFFDNDNYYESDLYIRNDLDLLLTKYLDENYFYYQALNDTVDGEIRTLHIYFDTEDPRFAEVVVGKQYNVGNYKDILLIYAPASSLIKK